MEELIFSDATVGYGHRPVLSSVNFKITRGETVLLLGPNGGGKTTLLRSVLELLPILSGERISTFRRIGYVPQFRYVEGLYPVSIEELVFGGLPFRFRSMVSWKKSERETKDVEEILDRFDLLSRRKKLIRECSGGELQKALIARGVVAKPDLLVLDEPVSSLDSQSREQFLLFVKEIREDWNPALLMTDHHGLKMDGVGRILEAENGRLLVREAVHA